MNRESLAKLLDRGLNLPDKLEHYSHEDGIRLMHFAIKCNPDASFLYFYLASVYSAVDDMPSAFLYFEESLKRGYRDWNKIYTDQSFARARSFQEFHTITTRYQVSKA